MFRCPKCGYEFTEDEAEWYVERDTHYSEPVCPKCYAMDVEEVEPATDATEAGSEQETETR